MPTLPQEIIPPDEAERFNGYATEIRAMQQARAKRRGTTDRALHPKPHVGVVGTLSVRELAPELRVAFFAEPAEWPCYVRFSNGAPMRQHDGVPDLRGVGLKIVGVPGRKVIAGLEDKKTQDFLMIPTPATAVRSPDDFVKLLRAAAKGRLLLVPRLLRAMGVGPTKAILKSFATMPKVRSLATSPFYTAAPQRFGDTAMKVGLFPSASDPPRSKGGRDALREDIVARLQSGSVTYSLRAQFYVDESATPIDDASVEWTAQSAPWHELGTLTLPRQDVTSPRGKEIEDTVERMSFDPWHSVEALRPIGSMMRARAVAYRESVIERGASDEPESVLEANLQRA